MLDQTMEKRIASNFYNKAKQLVSDDGEREQMFNMLRAYQETYDLPYMLDELKYIINEPNRLELFEAIRPLIPLKHQLEYDRLIPHVPGHRLRVIRLQRRPNESLGFAVRGGFEHGVGIYVSEVDSDSQAFHYGLRVGDEVVRVNGFTIDQAIHEEVLNLIKAKPEIVLKVRTVGMLPRREHVSDSVSWKYVERPDQSKHSMSWQMTEKAGQRRKPNRYSKLYVNLRGVAGLGCSICSGPAEFPGVFLQSIKAGSLAEEAGLGVGDQLIDVNGTSFMNITHSEAVVALKASSELYVTLHKGAGLRLFQTNDTPISAQQAGEEEKIRQFRNREKDERERKILAEEEVRQEEKRKEEQEEKRRKQQVEQEKKHRFDKLRDVEDREKKEREEMRERQDRFKKEAAEKAKEIQELKDRERINLEIKRKEERLEKKRKRLEKEKLHLQKVGEQSHEKYRRELQLRLERHKQDSEEMLREEMRLSNAQLTAQPPVRVWRPVNHVYIPATQEEDIVTAIEENFYFELSAFPEGGLPDMSNDNWDRPLAGPAFDNRPLKIEDARDEDVINFDPKKLFNPMEIGGRQINMVKIKRVGSLDIEIEGGMGTVLGAKIVISEVYPGGTVHKQGGIHRGDQLMMVDGLRLVDVTLTEAQSILDAVGTRPGLYVKLVVAKAPPKNYEDEILNHVPISNLDDVLVGKGSTARRKVSMREPLEETIPITTL